MEGEHALKACTAFHKGDGWIGGAHDASSAFSAAATVKKSSMARDARIGVLARNTNPDKQRASLASVSQCGGSGRPRILALVYLSASLFHKVCMPSSSQRRLNPAGPSLRRVAYCTHSLRVSNETCCLVRKSLLLSTYGFTALPLPNPWPPSCRACSLHC